MQYLEKWEHKVARERFPELKSQLGVPSVMCNQAGGLVGWGKVEPNPFIRHELRDERVMRCTAGRKEPTIDNFYSFLKVYMNPGQARTIQSIFSPVVYDGLTKEMRVRTGSLKENTSIAYAVLSYLMEDQQKPALLYRFVNEREVPLSVLSEHVVRLKGQNHEKFASQLVAPDCTFQKEQDPLEYIF